MTVYFDESKWASDWIPETGAIASIDDLTWNLYRWTELGKGYDIVNGQFIKLISEEVAIANLGSMEKRNYYHWNLELTDYLTAKYTEGLISEEEWIQIKAKRQKWREELNKLGY